MSYAYEKPTVEWYRQDMRTFLYPDGRKVWEVPNAPFEGTTAPLSACYLVDSNTLVVWRGTTAYWINNSPGNSDAWTKIANLPDVSPNYWKSVNSPFDNDSRPFDDGYWNPIVSNGSPYRFTAFRGEFFYYLANAASTTEVKVWRKGSMVKEKVPYSATHEIDFTAPNGPYHAP